MGKTYRKRCCTFSNREAYIKHRFEREYSLDVRRGFIWVAKPKAECQAEYEAKYKSAMDEFEKALEKWEAARLRWIEKELRLESFYLFNRRPAKPWIYVSKSKEAPVPSRQEAWDARYEKYAEEYDAMARDRDYDGKRKKMYRHRCATYTRAKNRQQIHKVIRGDDPDNMVWAEGKDGKQFIWDYW